mgnify:FL=1
MHSKKNNNSKSTNFLQGLRPFSSLIPHGLKKIVRKSGYNFSNIVDNWAKMVGKEVSDACYPCKMRSSKDMNKGILIVNVIHGKEIDVEYKKNEIINKINSFFGYSCIGEVKLNVIQEEKIHEVKHNKDNKMIQKFEKKLENLENDNLKNSLNKLVKAFGEKND